jgi:alpha-glucosidase
MRRLLNWEPCISVTLQAAREKPGKLRVLFRVFNDTIAFRSECPERAAFKDFDIVDEMTEFVFPAEHTTWWELAQTAAEK